MRAVLHAPQLARSLTGTDRVAYNVIRELQKLDRENTYEVECQHGNSYVPGVVTAPNFSVRFSTNRRRRDPRGLPARLRKTRERRASPPDIFFSFLNLFSPLFKVAPTASSVYDLIPLWEGDYFHPQRLHQFAARRLAHRTLRVADIFISASTFTANGLIDQCGISPNRVCVIPLAADPAFHPVEDESALARVRERYHLPRRFLLALGSTDPRKNVDAVVRAYQLVERDVQEEVGLVIAGSEWHGRSPAAWHSDTGGDVRSTGFVSDADLPALYTLADALVFPSLHEGFGMPVLEAMSCGTPVICSATTALPEVANASAALVDPENVEDVAAAIDRIVRHESVRLQLRERGLANAAQFSWQETARGVLHVLEELSRRGAASIAASTNSSN